VTYLTAIFGACPTCFTEFGQTFDQEASGDPKAAAEQALGVKIKQCRHDGLGADIVDGHPVGGTA
jgi:hypothetical protein